jgi:hypothetical protein
MNKLVSKNLSTQYERQFSSLREKLFPGVPVMHLDGACSTNIHREEGVTYLSQHMLVKLWIDE